MFRPPIKPPAPPCPPPKNPLTVPLMALPMGCTMKLMTGRKTNVLNMLTSVSLKFLAKATA